MKNFVFLFVFAVVLSFITSHTDAQTMFLADFENTSGSNDPDAWNAGAQTEGLINFIHVNHAGSGRLHQTLNTNANTTTVVAPTSADCEDWTDYTVQVTVTYDDNDCWFLVFRYTDADNYYMFSVEQGAAIARLWRAPAPDAPDARNGVPVAPDTPMPGVQIQGGAATEGNLDEPVGTEEWVVRAVVEGNNIKCYFFPREDIESLDDPAPGPPIIDMDDDSNSNGCVGIRNESIVGTIDDFAVYGPSGLAVDAREKLATTWGNTKAMHY